MGIYVNEIWGKEFHGYDRDLNAKTLEMPRTEAAHSERVRIVQMTCTAIERRFQRYRGTFSDSLQDDKCMRTFQVSDKYEKLFKKWWYYYSV